VKILIIILILLFGCQPVLYQREPIEIIDCAFKYNQRVAKLPVVVGKFYVTRTEYYITLVDSTSYTIMVDEEEFNKIKKGEWYVKGKYTTKDLEQSRK
jgi:hypothetical protein